MITRERSRAYADGARQGAPEAMPGADRVHLRQNLADALDQVLNTHGHLLAAVNAALHPTPVAQPNGPVAGPVPPPVPHTAQERAPQRQAQRRALHQRSRGWHQQGWPGWAMAQQLGLGRPTVDRYRRLETWPARQRRTDRGRRLLTPSTPSRLERWKAGCRDAVRLFHALHPRGDAGREVPVAR